MKISPEVVALALLTIATVFAVKGPILASWQALANMTEKVEHLETLHTSRYLTQELRILKVRIANAEKELSQQTNNTHGVLTFLEHLQTAAKNHGAQLLSWSEIQSQLWQAELGGNTQNLTQILHYLEQSMPQAVIPWLDLAYADQALVLKFRVQFDSDVTSQALVVSEE